MPLFDPKRLLVLAGPCSLENEKVVRTVAEKLVALRAKYPDLNFVFKGSFDKANRTSIAGGRGTGLEAGLALHALVKKDYGLPCVTDVHESDQCAAVAAVCDVLQIPAYLCRQTDLLLAAAATGKVVNVKKGQFLAPTDMVHVVGKLKHGGAAEISARLVEQITSSVLWGKSMRYLLTQGFTRFIELGPGMALSGFMKRIDKNAQMLNVADVASLEATVKALSI